MRAHTLPERQKLSFLIHINLLTPQEIVNELWNLARRISITEFIERYD